MATFRVTEFPGRSRTAAWNELYAAHVERAELLPADALGFDAELCTSELGPLRLTRLRCKAGAIVRGPRHLAAGAPRVFTFLLQSSGCGTFTHYGHQTPLQPGDFTLCDSAAPHSYRVTGEAELVMLRLPAAVLKEYLPTPEHYCGRHLPAEQGLARTVAQLARELCARAADGVGTDFQERIARHLLEMIGTSYAMAFRSVAASSSVICGRHAKVRLHIEQHLRDPQLSPCTIAADLKLSSRYLRMIFASSRETVSAYILRRRLEECARQMADPCWRGHSISEIAFAWGFNSASHFTRSFRERFGSAPRDYRRARFEESAAAAA